MKVKIHKEQNYKGIHVNGKTIRVALDESKPILELPLNKKEFLDIKCSNTCRGECPWCYMSSTPDEIQYKNIVKKFNSLFKNMSENDKPFQIAFGGGEPSDHPEFIRLLKACHKLGITPNYTTNGMWTTFSKERQARLLKTTKEYCGGVAVSTHPHLKQYWEQAVEKYLDKDIFTNLHIIIGDKRTSDDFRRVYDKYHNKVKYFVLLPLSAQGRCKKSDLDWEYLTTVLPKDGKDIAFGANFYPYLLNDKVYKMSLYEPELFSAFLDLKDNGYMYPSSFSNQILQSNLF